MAIDRRRPRVGRLLFRYKKCVSAGGGGKRRLSRRGDYFRAFAGAAEHGPWHRWLSARSALLVPVFRDDRKCALRASVPVSAYFFRHAVCDNRNFPPRVDGRIPSGAMGRAATLLQSACPCHVIPGRRLPCRIRLLPRRGLLSLSQSQLLSPATAPAPRLGKHRPADVAQPAAVPVKYLRLRCNHPDFTAHSRAIGTLRTAGIRGGRVQVRRLAVLPFVRGTLPRDVPHRRRGEISRCPRAPIRS